MKNNCFRTSTDGINLLVIVYDETLVNNTARRPVKCRNSPCKIHRIPASEATHSRNRLNFLTLHKSVIQRPRKLKCLSNELQTERERKGRRSVESLFSLIRTATNGSQG